MISVIQNSYEDRRDIIVSHAWDIWTRCGEGLDAADYAEAERVVIDAVNETYRDGIEDISWLAATLLRLSQEVDWPRLKPEDEE